MNSIQWYPGHMTKARREMEAALPLIDLILELVDARLPLSSRNPDIDRMGKNKARIVLLNKADLADERQSILWQKWFSQQGLANGLLDARSGRGIRTVQSLIRDAGREKRQRDQRRGIRNRPVRAMVVGIPNVGKSTFINSFVKKACTKTGNRPGVTKGSQWIRLNAEVELLDTPGLLWPKLEDQDAAVRLALVGSLNDEILDSTGLALEGITFMSRFYPEALHTRYEGLPDTGDSAEILQFLARHCLRKGGEPDTDRAAARFLEEMRSGKLGRITLEQPPKEETKTCGPEKDSGRGKGEAGRDAAV